MPTTYYHSVNGRLQGESTASVRKDYLLDNLGSIVAVVDQAESIEKSFRYKPFGSVLSQADSGVTPAFLYSGSNSFDSCVAGYSYVAWSGNMWSTISAQVLNYIDSNPVGLSGRTLVPNRLPGLAANCRLGIGSPAHYTSFVSPPVSVGTCGSWGVPDGWQIQWNVAVTREMFGNVGGYIVQEVQQHPFVYRDCRTGKGPVDTPKCRQYFELWYITPEGEVQVDESFTTVTSEYHDRWSFDRGISCTYGNRSVEAYAAFFAVDKYCYKHWHYNNGNGFDDGRGTLIGGCHAPPGWEGKRQLATYRFANSTWICCEMMFNADPCDFWFYMFPMCGRDTPTALSYGPKNV